ncbi:endo-1,4-D-glucanase [Citrobacter koseri]|nr:endo-1,4-D-glucanase [Citrobacter koseri]
MPGLGSMLLPGNVGFAEKTRWRFNPSYLPPQLAQYFTRFGAPWTTLRETNMRLLMETAPKGFSPDWVRYEKDKGWQLKPEKTLVSSYDAIRVYLWAGDDARRRSAKSAAADAPETDGDADDKKRRSAREGGCRQW